MTRAGVGFSQVEAAEQAGALAADLALTTAELDRADAVVVFASAQYQRDSDALLSAVSRVTQCQELVGCSCASVIVGAHEFEGERGVGVLALQSETMQFRSFVSSGAESVLTPTELARNVAEEAGQFAGESAGPNPLLLLFSDPLTLHPPRVLRGLVETCPMPVLGCATSRHPEVTSALQWGRCPVTGEIRAVPGGLAALLVTGEYDWMAGVAQSCRPVGEPLIVTEVSSEDNGEGASHIVRRMAGERAVDVIHSLIGGLEAADQAALRNGLFIGLALDESKLKLTTGDYLVRNVTGLNPDEGSIGVGDLVHEGQTVQFQLRDTAAARADLERCLNGVTEALAGREPLFCLYLNCLARGKGLLRVRHHDATKIAEALGSVPLTGLSTNSEIAPVGGRNLMHNYTGVLGVFADAKG